jgi:putative hydrolase of the HAD superfamily
MELDEFHETWSAVFLPDLIVPERLLANLKQRYPLILVSNTNESHVDYIARTYPVFDYFDHKIFSHEVGSLKPDREIYEAAIDAAGRPPEELFFTDDREENIHAARELGIHAHQFTSVGRLLDAFRRHGIDSGEFVHSLS